jgi:predicted amidohydrolase
MTRTVAVAATNFMIRPVTSFDHFADQVRGTLDQCFGAEIVVLPEYFTLGLFALVEGWREAPLPRLRELDAFAPDIDVLLSSEAVSRGQIILGGSTLVRGESGHANVCVLYSPDGTRHQHAKSHLVPEEREFADHEGDEMSVVDLGRVRVGIAICYEMELPECSGTLAELGAEVILCPSLTLTPAGFWRVRHCAAARAIENQVYVVHSCTGGEPDHPLPGGWAQASILAPCDRAWEPDGVLGEAPTNIEDVVVRTLDLDALHEMRAAGDATTFRDRRRRADVVREWPSHLSSAHVGGAQRV